MRFMGNIEHAMSVLNASKAASPAGTPQRNVVTNVAIPNSAFAQSAVAYTPQRRTAQTSGNVIYTQPSFFSPLHTPQNWQIPSKRREIYTWSFVKGDMLMTEDGTCKCISEVTEGDKLVTHTGEIQAVDMKTSRDVDTDLFTIRYDGHYLKTRLTRGHKIYVVRKEDVLCKYSTCHMSSRYCDSNNLHYMCRRTGCTRNQRSIVPELVPVEEVRNGDFVYTPTIKGESGGVPTTDHARLLGYYCSEGYLVRKGVVFSFGIHEDDFADEVIALSQKLFGDIRSIKKSKRPSRNTCEVFVYSSSLNAFCYKHCGEMASKKKLSLDLMTSKRDIQLNFLATYWNGDGCQSFTKGNHGRIDFRTSSKHLSEQVQAMLVRCGYPARCSFTRTKNNYKNKAHKSSKKPFFDCYTVSFGGSSGGDFFKLCKADLCSDGGRKSSVRLISGMLLRRISSVSSEPYRGMVYDVRVPGNYSVVCNGIAVTQCRYYYENEPKVASAIDFYSMFSINGFETQCEHHAVKRYFDNLNKKLNLDQWCKLISKEYYMLGDVFPFLEIECDKCLGSGVTEAGKPCRHPGGSFRRLVVLNPDWIDVQTNIMVDDPVITLIPDDELKKIVWRKQPKAIYDRLPANIRALILGNRPIPLSNECVSHLRHNPYPYGTYGTSLIRRLFKTLAYKDKLMSAQWIIAERMILPVRVVKLGDSERPAGPADIADVQNQLANVVNDPNLTLVTHHAFNYEWVGTSGKVLQLSNEYELIDKEILQGLMINEALLSGTQGSYQCHDMQTRVLTRNGFKHYDEVTDDDEIACFNRETGKLEYHRAISRHEYDFDGHLIHFKNSLIDIAVTDSHRMLFQPRGSDRWVVAPASKVGRRSRFRWTVGWDGSTDVPSSMIIGSKTMSLEDYLEIAAFYVTEGYVRKESRKSRSTYGDPMSACIYQTPKGNAWEEMLRLTRSAPVKIAHYESSHGDQFVIHDKVIAAHLAGEFGNGSAEKRIPKWIKNLPKEYLHKFLLDMVKGDGTRCVKGVASGKPHYYYRYLTISNRLKDDVVEIALKCGYSPRSRFVSKGNGIWQVIFSDGDLGRESILLHNRTPGEDSISKVPYKGRVWCFTVPTGFFVTERNGRVAIQGNSAAIGAEAMIQRMESWRLELARWIEDKIYKPIAQMKGFVDEAATKEIGEPQWIIPKISWNDLNIRDDSQQKQLFNALFDKGLVSGQTLLEKYSLDYDHEIERLRYESASQKLAGMGSAGAAAGGMIGGGMGGGGGAGGGLEGMFGGGGGMPPDAGGAPPGGAPPGGDMGGMAGGAPPAAAAGVGGTSGKILAKGRRPMSKVPDESEVQPVSVRLTSLEAMMHKEIAAMRLPFSVGVQQQIGPYVADFCIPMLRMDIEVDGEYWHNQPETKAHDQVRDKEMSQAGWTVLRFGEVELKERMPEVRKTILAYVNKNWRNAIEEQKRRTQALEASYGMLKVAGGELIEAPSVISPAEDETAS